LIDSGWSFSVALCITILLNCVLIAGAGFGLALGALNETVSMCTSLFVAGAFLYLALTLLMPEIKHGAGKCV
jgi:zinc transporter ZupT